MRIQRRKLIWALALCAVVCVSVTGGLAIKQSAKKQWRERRHVTDTLPPVISKVKKLQVLNAFIVRKGSPSASVVIEILNESDVAVTGFTVAHDDITVGQDGGIFNDEPLTVIEPHGTTTLSIPLSNLQEGEPLVIAAVFWADGTEEGQEDILKWERLDRARAKAKRAAKKGAPQQ